MDNYNNEELYNESVEFFIKQRNPEGGTLKRMVSGDKYETIPYNSSLRIPSFCVVTDTRPNSPTQGRPITIRYVEGEASIYTDKQSQEWDVGKYRLGEIKCPNIYFRNGRLSVNKANVTLLEYLRSCRFNDENAPQYSYRGKTFIEYKPESVAKDYIEKTDRQFELEYLARKASFEKSKSVLRVSGEIGHTTKLLRVSPDEARWYLIRMVKEKADKFDSVFNDPLLEAKYDILTALDLQKLRWTGAYSNILAFGDTGETVCNASQGNDKLQFAANYLFNQNPETYSYIRKLIGRGVETEAGKGTDSTDPRDIIAHGTREQIIDGIVAWHRDTSNEYKVFDDVKGADIRFMGEALVDNQSNKKGYDAAKKYLLRDENREVFNSVFQKWVEQVNSK